MWVLAASMTITSAGGGDGGGSGNGGGGGGGGGRCMVPSTLPQSARLSLILEGNKREKLIYCTSLTSPSSYHLYLTLTLYHPHIYLSNQCQHSLPPLSCFSIHYLPFLHRHALHHAPTRMITYSGTHLQGLDTIIFYSKPGNCYHTHLKAIT